MQTKVVADSLGNKKRAKKTKKQTISLEQFQYNIFQPKLSCLQKNLMEIGNLKYVEEVRTDCQMGLMEEVYL